MYTPEQFTAILKKTDYCNKDSEVKEIHTVNDYEKLRSYILEDGEVPNDTVDIELATFVTCGTAAWIYLHPDKYRKKQLEQNRQECQHIVGNLTVLLANIVES